VYELCRRWVAAGHKVTVVTAPYEKSDIRAKGFISRQEVKGIELLVINSGDSNRLPVLSRVLRALTFACISVFYALWLRYDVLIASSGPITIGLPLIAGKVIRRKRTIFEVRDLWPAGGIEMGLIKQRWQQKLALWFEKLCYRKADVVVTASIGQKAHIQDRYPGLRLEVIPNASDLELFGTPARETLPDWAKDKKLFTHIGSLGYIHNMRYWMEVARAMQQLDKTDNVRFVFIGDGADRAMLEQLKQDWELNNVYFLGLKPKAALPVWVQNSVATLFATLDNPVQDTCSPNKIFDSFAAGVPIVQTSNGWIKELVEQYNCGISVDLNTPQQAAQQMMELADSPEEIQVKGANALKLAQTQFNRDQLAEEYLSFLDA
jgi:glycosyltransferase involved in cell wall biosynthesis